jgi:hypothetical protein
MKYSSTPPFVTRYSGLSIALMNPQKTRNLLRRPEADTTHEVSTFYGAFIIQLKIRIRMRPVPAKGMGIYS